MKDIDAKLIVDYVLTLVAQNGKIVGRGTNKTVMFNSIGINMKSGETFEVYEHTISEVDRLMREVNAADIAALTADLAARDETIVRLEGELAIVEAVLADTREVYAMSVEIENRLIAQLIEERWQKNRAEFYREHTDTGHGVPCFIDAVICVDPRHDYNFDDWRRDAKEQLINEGVIKT